MLLQPALTSRLKSGIRLLLSPSSLLLVLERAFFFVTKENILSSATFRLLCFFPELLPFQFSKQSGEPRMAEFFLNW